MRDLRQRLAAQPETIDELLGLVVILDVNEAALSRYGYRDRDELVADLGHVYSSHTRELYAGLFCALLAGQTTYTAEDVSFTRSGEQITTLVTFSVAPGHERTWDLVFCSDPDITGQKAAEELATLQRDVLTTVASSDDLPQAFSRLLDLLVSLDPIDAAWIHRREADGALRLAAARGISEETIARIERYPAASTQVLSAGVEPAYGPYRRLLAGSVHPAGIAPELDALRTTARLPLLHDGQLRGILALGSRSCDSFPAHTRRLVEIAATEVDVALTRVRAQDELRRSERKMRALLTASRAITSSIDYDEVLAAIAQQAGEALDVPECAIWEYLHETDEEYLRTLYQRTPDDTAAGQLIGQRYPLDQYPRDREFMLANRVVEEHIDDPELPEEARASMARWGEQATLSVPLQADGRPLGLMILIETAYRRDFSDDERELAQALGDQAAFAMRNAQLYRSLQTQLKVRHDLLTLSESLLSSLDAESIFDRVASTLKTLVSYDSLTIGVVETDGSLRVLFADGQDAGRMIVRRLPLEQGVTAAVLASGIPELVNDMLRDPRANQAADTAEEEQASILAPIRLGPRRGLLAVNRHRGWRFEKDDLETVRLFASLAAVALENADLYRIAEQQAITDGLTGLYNHRHFYERLGMELARAKRESRPLALLMIDLDDFKQLNDDHGHPAGDEVLRAVGRVLSEGTRTGVDLAARYGGEEFAVFLPGSPSGAAEACADEATVVAERLRQTVEAIDIEYGDDPGRITLKTTVSIGVALYPATARTMGELVAQADAALYQAKRRGKNRVEVYTGADGDSPSA